MKEKNQDVGWLILYFIASGFFGFLTSLLFHIEETYVYILCSLGITIVMFIVINLIVHIYNKKTYKKQLRDHLLKGAYQEVLEHIERDGKNVDHYWELMSLSLFYQGNIPEFRRLYQTYMNEINEGTTLECYIIAILYDLLVACESRRKPVRFMKGTEYFNHKYTKQSDYLLYRNLRLGLEDFYKQQNNNVKIYFDKFLQQSNILPKPLGFYLYYLITQTMIDTHHSQVEVYMQKTKELIFDQGSLNLVNQNLRIRMNEVQKGYRDHNDMNREFDRNRRQPMSQQNTSSENLNHSFDYQQPTFNRTTPADERFAKRRSATRYQDEFDSVNQTLESTNAFPLYEDNEFDQLPKRTRQVEEPHQQQTSVHEDPDIALDPTWFARKNVQEEQVNVRDTTNFSRRNPKIQSELENPQMVRATLRTQRNPMQQDPFQEDVNYQEPNRQTSYMDMQQTARTHSYQEEPEFVNQRNFQQTAQTQATTAQNPRFRAQQTQQRQQINPAMRQPQQPQPEFTQKQMSQRQQQMQQTPFPQHQNPMMNTGQMNMSQQQRGAAPQMQSSSQGAQVNTQSANDRFNRYQQGPSQASQQTMQTQMHQKQQMTMQESDVPKVSTQQELKRKHFNKRKETTYPFGFEDTSSATKQPFTNEQHIEPSPQTIKQRQTISQKPYVQTPYRTYVRQNMIILGITLINSIIISIASSSFVYTSFFNKYPLNSDIIPDIVVLALLVAFLLTYATAAVHTGYTIMKKYLRNWNGITKIIASPILLLVYAFIGIICEVPYLIYAGIKISSQE